jgi:hypothetical protein
VLLKIKEPINPLAVNVSSISLGLRYVPCPNDMLVYINCGTAASAMMITSAAHTVDLARDRLRNLIALYLSLYL